MSDVLRAKIGDLKLARNICVFDVGAAEFDSTSVRYAGLASRGLCDVVGFEPNQPEWERLCDRYSGRENYRFLNVALGDGMAHQLKICRMPGCSSLLEPNVEFVSRFHGFPEFMEVVGVADVNTVTMDSLAHLPRPDLIKLDAQGSELMILSNAVDTLSTCLVIECEVEFGPQYEMQPLFSEVELFMRNHGFSFHSFLGFGSRNLSSFVTEDAFAPGSQWLWSDALFVRQIDHWNMLSNDELSRLAVILFDIYHAEDFAAHALSILSARRKEVECEVGASCDRYAGVGEIP
ncbi:MAG TPA: FkbM family methyltransferase [Afipia sp.]